MKTLNQSVLLCIITTFFVFTFENILAENDTNVRIDSDDQARLIAEQYTGFGKIQNLTRDYQFTIDTLSITNDKTPFINNMINNRKLHRVLIDSIPARSLKKVDYNMPPLNFEILLDSETGKLLKISTKLKDTSDVKNRDDLIKTNRRFSGFPDVKPYPFLEILRKCPFALFEAAEIEAVYILRKSKAGEPDIPTWIVSLYSVPKVVSPPSIDSDSMFIEKHKGTTIVNIDVIFDGVTGKLLTAHGISE
ncbi:MAG: hypothetical protein GY865_02400 [candidate division Zixibacteria bacterium]|nr:hypothetical protein [candidate division Zixibacteria bacterium]